MNFRVLGHACLEVNGATTLLCDPWLVGSCYWRSWWNYPPVPQDLTSALDPDHIYLSHLHWDHFHVATLKRLGTNRRILIPKTPECRMRDDLKAAGFHNIVELPHAERIRLAPNFWVTSYQFYWFTDSALVIECDGVTILNTNDAKIFGAPLRQILARHPQIDFVLRSHSSANARVCYEISDRDGKHVDDLEKYSQEFAAFVAAVKAKYAIPFASNHCYLHWDTFQFNSITNYSSKVVKYFEREGITQPECVQMAPGDGWSASGGFALQQTDWYEHIDDHLARYRREKLPTLLKLAEREARTKPDDRIVARYEAQLATVPFPIRRLFKGHPITMVLQSGNERHGLGIDIARARCQWLSTPDDASIQIHTATRIFNECVMRGNWNSLTISKRLHIKVRQCDKKFVDLFIVLNKCFDHGLLPLRGALTWRFISVWLHRWRELALYTQLFVNHFLRRRPFRYADYL